MRFISVWVSVIVIFFVLNLSMSIFSPIINGVLSDLVDIYAWNNPQLLSAKMLVVGMFNLSPYWISVMALVWGVLSSLRREESDYYV